MELFNPFKVRPMCYPCKQNTTKHEKCRKLLCCYHVLDIQYKTIICNGLRFSCICILVSYVVNNKENIKIPHYWPFIRGIHCWPVDSPHNRPAIQIAFPCLDIIMHICIPLIYISFSYVIYSTCRTKVILVSSGLISPQCQHPTSTNKDVHEYWWDIWQLVT